MLVRVTGRRSFFAGYYWPPSRYIHILYASLMYDHLLRSVFFSDALSIETIRFGIRRYVCINRSFDHPKHFFYVGTRCVGLSIKDQTIPPPTTRKNIRIFQQKNSSVKFKTLRKLEKLNYRSHFR